MKKLLLLLMAVLLVVSMAVPSFASEGNSNYYNFGGDIGYVSTMIHVGDNEYQSMFDLSARHIILDYMADENRIELAITGGDVVNSGLSVVTVGEQFLLRAVYDFDKQVWFLTQEELVEDGTSVRGSGHIDWTFNDIYWSQKLNDGLLYLPSNYGVCDGSTCPATDVNMDNVCDDCGMPFSVPRDYTLEPFTVTKFMNHIGQIFTSAVSWVSDVGAAILAQPLLLAFTALPLCGLGIAVFRRMKETV